MPIRNVAVIFDNQVRPDTTGVYCRRALGKLVRVEHFLPSECFRIPDHSFDLYLQIDDGLETRLPTSLRPCAWWVIDTHLNFDWYRERAHEFDCVFAAQRDGAEKLRQDGVTSTSWLPLACDPEFHRKHQLAKVWDLCFVGNLFPGPRQELLALLQKHFPSMFVGQRYFEDMAATYSAARMTFNRSIRNDINMRVFEALACGSLLVTNDLAANGQEELFRDGVHLATYSNSDELLDKLQYYLEHERLREKIADCGRAEAVLRHTYRVRMQQLLAKAERHLSRTAAKTAGVPFALPNERHFTSISQGRLSSAEPSMHDRGIFPQKDADAVVAHAVRVSSPAVPEFGLTSIVILTHNQLAFTKLCIESIRNFTEEPYELIFVDNGSTDGTVTYLHTLRNAFVVANDDNRGFPAAANQGIQAAKGEQVLLLNNDTVVTSAWLTRLLRALHSDPTIGLVGPCTNCASGEQQILVSYDDLSDLEGFACEWGRLHHREQIDTDRLIGFCLLIRREVIEKIGLLDERFGLGCFEDDDYCLRALQNGFRARIVRDAFVHHFGGRTFVGSGVAYDELLHTNQRLFQTKWAHLVERDASKHLSVPSGFSLRSVPEGGLRLVRHSIQLSLCMIVRDNARTIGACLASIRPWVDEMVIVDTGSKDHTPRIAEQLGARICYFPWPDSFSIARNESLRHARGRWLFWMDSDDTIDDVNGRKLQQLASSIHDPNLLGFVMQVHCPGPGDDGQVTVVDHVKLFRNLPSLRFEGRIHEQIIPAIRKAGGQIAWSDVFVVHSGYDHSPQGQEKKKQRDLHLLHLELDEQPQHPFTLFNLGMTYADIGQYGKAVEFLTQSLHHAGDGDSHVRKVYALLTHSLQCLNRFDDARDYCDRGLRLFPNDTELVFRKAVLLHDSGQLREAAQVYQDLISLKDEPHFKSVVRGLKGYLARQNLACLYTEMGDLSQAEGQWRLVLEEVPRYRPGWRGLAEVLLREGKQQEVTDIANRLMSDQYLRNEGLFLSGQVAWSRGDMVAARRELERAANDSSSDRHVLDSWCRFLFEHGDPAESEKALKRLLSLDPKDPATLHNLGSNYVRMGDLSEAIAAFRESIRYRPESFFTHLQLGNALRRNGQLDEAVATWREVLRLAPDNQEAADMLDRYAFRKHDQPNASSPERKAPNEKTLTLPTAGGDIHVSLQLRGRVDESILEEVWRRDVYGVRQLTTIPATVLDIGAHIGCFSLLAAQTWPTARIIACEADSENAAVLRNNVLGRRNIEIVEAAIVGDDVPEVVFNAVVDKAAHNSGGGSCVRDEPWTIRTLVSALAVTRLWRQKSLTSCDLLKLDCEGAELAILRSLSKAGLLQDVFRVVGEWHATDDTADSRERVKMELHDIFETTHEVVFNRETKGKEGYFVATHIAHWGGRQNVL